MAKQTHLVTTIRDAYTVDVACGKVGVEPPLAENAPEYVTCQRCLGRLAGAFNDFGRDIYRTLVAEKVLGDPGVQRATKALKEKMDDALHTIDYFLMDARREVAHLERAISSQSRDDHSGIGPLYVAMYVPRTMANALNNLRTDLLASYGAALEAEIARARKEA